MRKKRKEKTVGKIKIDSMVQKQDDGIYVSFENLRDIARAFTKQEGFSLSRKMIQVFDADEDPKKSDISSADGLKTDIDEIISDGGPVECEGCHNKENFSVFVSQFHLTLEEGKKIKSLYLENEGVIAKPDTIVFICQNCGKVVIESSVY